MWPNDVAQVASAATASRLPDAHALIRGNAGAGTPLYVAVDGTGDKPLLDVHREREELRHGAAEQGLAEVRGESTVVHDKDGTHLFHGRGRRGPCLCPTLTSGLYPAEIDLADHRRPSAFAGGHRLLAYAAAAVSSLTRLRG